MFNLFIGLSNNQVSAYELLISQNILKKYKNILITSKSISFNNALWNEIIYSNKSFNNQPLGKTSAFINIYIKIIHYKRLIQKLKKYKNAKQITLYFTYIEDILTNFLLLSFNKNLKGIVIEDGTLNYYWHTIKSIPLKKRIIKWSMSNLLGIRYKFYKGHSSGIEYDHVIKQFVKAPSLSLFPEKSVQMPLIKKDVLLSNTALIIGQEAYINMFGLKRYQKALSKLISKLQSKPYYSSLIKIYYKPHRHGQRIDYGAFKKHFFNKEIEILEEDTSLEDMYFNHLGSKYIFSFDSSAVINIYLEADDELKDKLNFNIILEFNKALKPIFEKFKFSIN